MKYTHNILEILHHTGNMLLVLLLLSLVALPAVSFGLMHVKEQSNVLGSQDIRLKIDLEEAENGMFYYNETQDRILPKSEAPARTVTEPMTVPETEESERPDSEVETLQDKMENSIQPAVTTPEE